MKSGASPQTYYTVTLHNVVVASMNIANLRDALAEWSLQYARLGLAFPK